MSWPQKGKGKIVDLLRSNPSRFLSKRREEGGGPSGKEVLLSTSCLPKKIDLKGGEGEREKKMLFILFCWSGISEEGEGGK